MARKEISDQYNVSEFEIRSLVRYLHLQSSSSSMEPPVGYNIKVYLRVQIGHYIGGGSSPSIFSKQKNPSHQMKIFLHAHIFIIS